MFFFQRYRRQRPRRLGCYLAIERLEERLVPNAAPTTTGIGPVKVDEDATGTVIDLFAAFEDAEDPDSALTFEITKNSNPSLFRDVAIDGVRGELVLEYAANAHGTSAMTVQATDTGGKSVSTNFPVMVRSLDDPPVAKDDVYDANKNEQLIVPASAGVLANDSDADGDALTAVLVTDVAHGTLTLSADGSFVYTPAVGYSGSDQFSYRASDGSLSSSVATVTLTVQTQTNAPVAVADAYSVNEDAQLSVPVATGVLANDSDADGDALTAVLVTDVTHGTLALSADGAFVYTPVADYSGSDQFSYQASDGGLSSAVTTVTLTVQSQPDAPLAVADAYSVNEDAQLSVPVATGVLANDGDADGDALTAVLVTDVTHGTLALSADGAFVYTPVADYSGSDQFSYQASDGGLSSAVTTVTLTVQSQPDAPLAVADVYSVNEDAQLSVPVATGVLANDGDADGDALTAVLVTDVTHGTLALSADGAFIYTPVADYSGSDQFSYQASDGGLSSAVTTVTLTVQSQPDAPLAVADVYSVNKDVQLIVPVATGVLANDSDADGDALTAVLVADVTHGTLALSGDGSFVYTPAADYSGSDQFSYRASDGSLSSSVAMVTLTVQTQTNAPVAVADAYSVNEDNELIVPVTTGVLANDSDADGDALTAVLVADVTHGTLVLSADGSFVYTPAADYSGSDQFSYQASDSGLSSPVTTVTLTVNALPDAPEADADAYGVNEDAQLVVPMATGVLANDSDADGDTLTAVLVADVTHGTLALSADGSFVYTPAPDYSGNDQFSYRANDGGSSSPVTTVTLAVQNQPDAPESAADAYSINEDDQLSVPVTTGVLANDSDADGDAITAVLVTNVTHGTLALSADGSFVYTPVPDYSGSDQFSYQASDGGLSSPVTTVTLTVNALPDAPEADADAYGVNEDAQLVVPMATGVLANDSDADGDTLTAVLVADVTHGTLALSADGSFVYTPAPDYSGNDQFSYRANDGGSSSPVTTVTLAVQNRWLELAGDDGNTCGPEPAGRAGVRGRCLQHQRGRPAQRPGDDGRSGQRQ